VDRNGLDAVEPFGSTSTNIITAEDYDILFTFHAVRASNA
jgi:hypothetical protein